jgi:hypothetical protein
LKAAASISKNVNTERCKHGIRALKFNPLNAPEADMEHPRCATCRHYTTHTDTIGWDIPPNFGTCKLIKMSDGMTEWDGESYRKDEDGDDVAVRRLRPEYAQHLAGVMDGSSYRAELQPAPEFYCPMHSDLMPQLVS